MLKWRIVFQCVAEAVYAKGLHALARLVPYGESIYDIASEAWERLCKRYAEERETARLAALDNPAEASKHPAVPSSGSTEADLKAGLEAVACLTPEQVKQEATLAAQQAGAGQPPEVREALASYLSQMPGVIRRSLRRPQDPTGTTVPKGMPLQKPDHLLPFLPTSLPRFKPGDRPLGNWQLVELLGAGGFGEVWKAEHPQLKELPPVALKFCLDPTAGGFLRHEASLLARVMQQRNTPGVVALRQAYLEHDPVCLEYEYIDGGDLAGVVRQLAPLPPPKRVGEACEIVRRLARTIGTTHRLKPPIVHRDLKPANVLVRKDERGKLEFLVADFGIGGIAAQQALTAARPGTTARGSLLATALRGSHTPLYASPQQAHGEPPDPRDDIHALGVIWYQLLTGDLNSGAPTGLDWADEIKRAGMSEDLVRLLGSCVAHKPDHRPPDAADLAVRMTKLIADAEEANKIVTVELVEPSAPPTPGGGAPTGRRAPTTQPAPAEEVLDGLPADEPSRPAPPTRPRSAPPAQRPLPAQERRTARPAPAPATPVAQEVEPVSPARRARSGSPPPQPGNKVRSYAAPDLDLDGLIDELERWLVGDGFQCQSLNTEDGGLLLQIQRSGGWRAWVGMSTAMNIVLRHRDGELMVEIGAGRWVDKAAGGVVGLLVLWPLAVTAAIGAWDQMQMPERVFQQIASVVHARKRRAAALPAPPALATPSPASGLDADVFAQLERLGGLKDRGIITEEEFQKQKARLLG